MLLKEGAKSGDISGATYNKKGADLNVKDTFGSCIA